MAAFTCGLERLPPALFVTLRTGDILVLFVQNVARHSVMIKQQIPTLPPCGGMALGTYCAQRPLVRIVRTVARVAFILGFLRLERVDHPRLIVTRTALCRDMLASQLQFDTMLEFLFLRRPSVHRMARHAHNPIGFRVLNFVTRAAIAARDPEQSCAKGGAGHLGFVALDAINSRMLPGQCVLRHCVVIEPGSVQLPCGGLEMTSGAVPPELIPVWILVTICTPCLQSYELGRTQGFAGGCRRMALDTGRF